MDLDTTFAISSLEILDTTDYQKSSPSEMPKHYTNTNIEQAPCANLVIKIHAPHSDKIDSSPDESLASHRAECIALSNFIPTGFDTFI